MNSRRRLCFLPTSTLRQNPRWRSAKGALYFNGPTAEGFLLKRFLAAAFLAAMFISVVPLHGQAIGQNFTGSSRSQSTFIPPDTMGAVGPSHFIELINGRYAVYEKFGTNNANGTRTPLFSSTLNAFWSNAGAPHTGAFAFDPRIVYDPFSERFFAAAVDNQRGNNSFMLAVSASSNPFDGWRGFKIDSDSSNTRWADFPTLGFNADGVFLAANMFAQPGQAISQQTTIIAVPKSDLLAPVPSTANRRIFENVAATTAFSVQPAVNLDNTSDAIFGSFAGFFRRTDLVGPISTGNLASNTLTTVFSYGDPPEAEQPGPKANLNTLDDRMSANLVLQEGVLWGVQTVNFQGRASLHWFKIRTSDNFLLQDGLIADSDLAFYYGSLAVNEYGDVVIAASGSSENQFVSSYAFVGDSLGDTVLGATTFGGPLLLKAGVDDYEVFDSSGRNRWGDYSATMLDPSDPFSFWTIQEFVSADNQYSLQVTQILIPEPAALGAIAVVMILLIRRRRADGQATFSSRGSGQLSRCMVRVSTLR